jgi:hypothetical protein
VAAAPIANGSIPPRNGPPSFPTGAVGTSRWEPFVPPSGNSVSTGRSSWRLDADLHPCFLAATAGRPCSSGRRPSHSSSPGQRPGEAGTPGTRLGPTGQPFSRRTVGPLARRLPLHLRCPGRCPGLGEPVPLRGDCRDCRIRRVGEIMTLVREPDAGNPPVRFDEREVETEHGMRPVRHRPGNPAPEYGETCPTAPLLNSTVFRIVFYLGWLTHPEKRARINSVAMPWCRRGSADCLGDCRR